MAPAPFTAETLFAIFALLWLGLMVTGIFLFYRKGRADLKRRWLSRYVLLGGGLCIGFLLALMLVEPGSGPPPVALACFIPLVAMVTYLNFRIIRFCANCGQLINPYARLFSPVRHCPHCGSQVDKG